MARPTREVSAEYLASWPRTRGLTRPRSPSLGDLARRLFMGNTLRGLLLNAYAFGTMGTIAGYAAIGAFIGAGPLPRSSAFLGLRHAKQRSKATADHPQAERVDA